MHFTCINLVYAHGIFGYSDLSKSENQVGENNAKWTEKVKWLIWYLTQRYDNLQYQYCS